MRLVKMRATIGRLATIAVPSLFQFGGSVSLAQARTVDCAHLHWSEEPSSNAPVLKFPSIAESRSGWLVAGNSILDYQARQVGPLVGMFDSSWTQLPFARVSFGAYPQIATLSSAGVLAVWGELAGDGTHSDWPPDVVSVWSAEYSGAWIRRQLIYRGASINWDNIGASRLQVDQLGRVIVAFPATAVGKTAFFVVARYESGRWSTTEVRAPSPVRGLHVSLVRGDTLVAVYLVPGTRRSLGGTTALMTWSHDFGATWTRPRAIVSADSSDVDYTRVALVRGRLHLIWLSTTAVATSLRQTEFSLSDSVARPIDEVTVPNGLNRIRVLETVCGIHVIGDDFFGGTMTGSVIDVRWLGKWATPDRLFPNALSSAPDGFVGRDGSVVIVANVRAVAPQPGEVFRLRIARLTSDGPK